jgi:hypothetical protein
MYGVVELNKIDAFGASFCSIFLHVRVCAGGLVAGGSCLLGLALTYTMVGFVDVKPVVVRF